MIRLPFIAALLASTAPLLTGQQTIGRTSATEVQVSGAVSIAHGETTLGNGSEITAGNQAVKIALERGGELQLCQTSSVHLSKDRSIDDPANSALMMALDRGAMEANYSVGKYSDVLITPDLRILISGPGQAQLSIRINAQGDTCIDNHGAGAPYVTVSSQFEGGAYRVMPDQRVSFQHGSLTEVVDHEPEPCGCPTTPAVNVAKSGGPSSNPSDTAFPVAESEGLLAPPAPRSVPTVPPGETHAEVTVPLTYSGEKPPAPSSSAAPPSAPAVVPATPPSAPASEAPPAAPANPPPTHNGVFHRIGHFFARIFGK